MKYILIVSLVFLSKNIYSQALSGINTKNPLTRLHLVSDGTSKSGIILPSWENGFLLNNINGVRESQLGWWENHGYYYWGDQEFVKLATNVPNRIYSYDLYCFIGNTFQPITQTNNTRFNEYMGERRLILNEMYANSNDNFSLDDGFITIGKKGLYNVSINLSFIKIVTSSDVFNNSASPQDESILYPATAAAFYNGRQWRKYKSYDEDAGTPTYKITLYKGETKLIESYITHSNEKRSGANVVINKVLRLKKNDVIHCVIQKLEAVVPPIYESFGTNSIVLTYISN